MVNLDFYESSTANLQAANSALGNALGFLNGALDRKQNKEMNEIQMEREDTAVQRRVRDLMHEGLHPALAAGSGASAQPLQRDNRLAQQAMRMSLMMDQQQYAISSIQKDILAHDAQVTLNSPFRSDDDSILAQTWRFLNSDPDQMARVVKNGLNYFPSVLDELGYEIGHTQHGFPMIQKKAATESSSQASTADNKVEEATNIVNAMNQDQFDAFLKATLPDRYNTNKPLANSQDILSGKPNVPRVPSAPTVWESKQKLKYPPKKGNFNTKNRHVGV